MTANVVISSIPWGQDTAELGKWLALHRCGIEPVEGKLSVRIPLTCVWLSFDKHTGVASCFDYENRPAICREYFCQRAIGD